MRYKSLTILFKIFKLSKYAFSLACNPREEISHSEIDVSDNLMDERREIMLHENMDISHLIVHAQHVVESRLK